MVRDTVRRFVSDRVLPDIATWSDQGVFPNELAKEMEAGDSGFRSFVSVQGSLAMFPIWAYGSEQHKQQWLPGMAAGEPIGCFGLSEHDSGSDPSSMTTNARRDGDDWILNGAKMWITNGSVADVAIVWARDTTDDRVRGFVVPTDTPGFTTNDVKQKLSLRVSVTSELVLQDVRLPAVACFPASMGCVARSRVSTRRVTASSGALRVPHVHATNRRSMTPWSVHSSASRSRGSN